MYFKRSLFYILTLFLPFSIAACDKQSPTQMNGPEFKLQTSNIEISEIKMRSVSMNEDEREYLGVEYGIVVILNDIPLENEDEIGFGLVFKGKTQEIHGHNGGGWIKGFSVLEEESSSKKIYIPMAYYSNHMELSGQEYLLSEAAKEDLEIEVFYNEEFMFSLDAPKFS